MSDQRSRTLMADYKIENTSVPQPVGLVLTTTPQAGDIVSTPQGTILVVATADGKLYGQQLAEFPYEVVGTAERKELTDGHQESGPKPRLAPPQGEDQ